MNGNAVQALCHNLLNESELFQFCYLISKISIVIMTVNVFPVNVLEYVEKNNYYF